MKWSEIVPSGGLVIKHAVLIRSKIKSKKAVSKSIYLMLGIAVLHKLLEVDPGNLFQDGVYWKNISLDVFNYGLWAGL